MKNILLIVSIFSTILFAFSCEEKEDPEPATTTNSSSQSTYADLLTKKWIFIESKYRLDYDPSVLTIGGPEIKCPDQQLFYNYTDRDTLEYLTTCGDTIVKGYYSLNDTVIINNYNYSNHTSEVDTFHIVKLTEDSLIVDHNAFYKTIGFPFKTKFARYED